jgi:23S rRNA maturation-related 3'-5' exoribonuclease YhaM
MVTNFDDIVSLISSPKINKFIKKALKAAPKEFWTAPASSGGKYHPQENRTSPGGLIIHTRKMVQIAIDLLRFFDSQNSLTRDIVIAAIILHDSKKSGHPWGRHTRRDHAHIGADWILRDVCTATERADPDILEISRLVRAHMGIWNYPEPTPAIVIGKYLDRRSLMSLIVQLADYWSSRKWCSFVCDTIIL